MGFNFQKQSQYSRHQIYQTVTGTEDSPNFDMGQTGYGRIDDDLFIFMNIGIPGADGMDYKNHYDERTESVSWCAKKKTHSGQPVMQKIINGDLNLYLFSRWERNEDWTYLGNAHVVSYQDNVIVADPDGNETYCMEYQLTCKGIEEDLGKEEIKSGELVLKNQKPKSKPRKKLKRNFKGRKQTDYLLKAKKDKKTGELGEELVLEYEKKKLSGLGRIDLVNAIEHVSKTQGDGTGYDIKSFDEDGTEIFIEVKTTKQGINTEFFMSPNEIEFSELHFENYYLYRVYDLRLNPLNGSLYIHHGNILDGFDTEPTEFLLKSK